MSWSWQLVASVLLPWSIAEGAARRQLGGEAAIKAEAYVSKYEIIHEFPHDPTAFTQGLAFDPHGNLYESDGLYGRSAVRSVEVNSGRSQNRTANAAPVFGEGIVVIGQKLVQLSWRNQMVFEYSLPGLKLLKSRPVHIGAEGWGIATDGQVLFITDSGSSLFHVDPATWGVIKEIPIVDPKLGSKKIYGVNELEMISGELWGNVYPLYQHKHSECVVRIDPKTGHVLGWVDFHGLLAKQRLDVRLHSHEYVLNGIAYHEPSHRLYVTGKQWDRMYQVRLKAAPDLGPTHIRSVCNLG